MTIEFSTDSANNTFTIKAEGWKFTSGGAVSYNGSADTWMSSPTSDLTDGSAAVSSAVVNTTDLFIGAHCNAALTTDAAVSGTLDIFVEYSVDGGTTWPSDAADFDEEQDLDFVTSIRVGTTSEDRSVPFEM
ncbi:MAG: hypothetical protein ACXABF_08835 [Candidatus Thorarchaeota archaeon]